MRILKNKWVKGILFFFLWIVIFGISQKLWGVVNLLIGGYYFYNLFYKNEKFKTKNKITKIVAGSFIIFFTLSFGAAGLTYDDEEMLAQNTKQEQLKAQKQQEDEQKKLDDQKKAEEDAKKAKEVEEKKKADEAAIAAANSNQVVNGELKVHFINVGQADSILVQQGSQAMLVDAGNNPDGNTVKDYLTNQGVKSLDFLIGTHPHEDHIGGLDYVINSFKVGKIFMPKTTSSTKTFEDVVTAAKGKELSFTAPTPGESFKVGDATCTILAPNGSGYEDPNNYSIVLKVNFGSTSFLLSGDAENISEDEMISKGIDLSSTVLKVGHHGSDSSTTSNYLTKVSPKYAVISVGKDNSYGHPKQSVMDRLKSKGIEVYRTDENGTVVATSNGTTVTFNTKPGSYTGNGSDSGSSSNSSSSGNSAGNGGQTSTPAPKPPVTTPAPNKSGDKIVYWVPNGKSFHFTKSCSTLARSKTILDGPLSSCPKSDPCDKCAH